MFFAKETKHRHHVHNTRRPRTRCLLAWLVFLDPRASRNLQQDPPNRPLRGGCPSYLPASQLVRYWPMFPKKSFHGWLTPLKIDGHLKITQYPNWKGQSSSNLHCWVPWLPNNFPRNVAVLDTSCRWVFHTWSIWDTKDLVNGVIPSWWIIFCSAMIVQWFEYVDMPGFWLKLCIPPSSNEF